MTKKIKQIDLALAQFANLLFSILFSYTILLKVVLFALIVEDKLNCSAVRQVKFEVKIYRFQGHESKILTFSFT